MNTENQKGVSLILTLFTASYIFFIGRVRALNKVRQDIIMNSERGVSLILTLFIMIILLAVVLVISILLFSEVKIIKNIGDSVIGLYAADSGVEKVLYYDSKVLPSGATRGLCSMLDTLSSGHCPSGSSAIIDNSVYCNTQPNKTLIPEIQNNDITGCDSDKCNNCKIAFETTFDNRTYDTTATISSNGTDSTSFDIQSKGAFGSAERQIEVTLSALKPEDAIIVSDACATPISNPQGTIIKISAYITATLGDTIVSADATIHDLAGNIIANVSLNPENDNYVSDTWSHNWQTTSATPVNGYYVNLVITDSIGPTPNVKTLTNLSPEPFCHSN